MDHCSLEFEIIASREAAKSRRKAKEETAPYTKASDLHSSSLFRMRSIWNHSSISIACCLSECHSGKVISRGRPAESFTWQN